MSRRAEFPGEEVGKVIRFGLVEVVYEWAKGMARVSILRLVVLGVY